MADEYQKRIDLGIFTAYGEAVNAGYEGTKEEFEAGLVASASYAENAQASAEAAAASETAAETAQGKAEDAQEAAETAQGKAEDAQTAAEAAQSAAETAALTLTIDPTLTQSGQAADAKVTGDAIGTNDAILSLADEVDLPTTVAETNKYIDNSGSGTGDSQSYCTTVLVPISRFSGVKYARVKVTTYTTHVAAIAFYNAEKTFISCVNAKTGQAAQSYEDATVSSFPEGAAYVAMSIFKSSSPGTPYLKGVPKLSALSDDVAALDSASTEQAAAIAANTEAIAGNAGHISDLQEENSAQTGRIVTLEENAETQASAVSALQDIAVAQAESLASLGETSSSHTTQIAALDSGKVDKVEGKGLSENDFTDADLAALDNIKTTDATLSVSGKAADAKVTGDALTVIDDDIGVVEDVLALEDIDSTLKVEYSSKYIDYQTGAIETSSNYNVTDKIPTGKYSGFTFSRIAQTQTSPSGASIAFYTDQDVFISSVRNAGSAASLSYRNYTISKIPEGAAYLRMTLIKDSGAGTPYLYGRTKIRTIADTAEDTAQITDHALEDNVIVNFKDHNKWEWTIGTGNNFKWNAGNATYNNSFVIPTDGYRTIRIDARADQICYYVKLNSACPTAGERPDAVSGTERRTIAAGGSVTIDNSDNATKYLYVLRVDSSGNNHAPRRITLSTYDANPYDEITELREKIEQLQQLIFGITSIGTESHDIPQNQGVRNFLDRVNYVRTVPWSSVGVIPLNAAYGSDLEAGDHTGIIYSSVKEKMKFVGWNVSFKTFFTAAHNPYSLLYTENVSKTESASGYGFTYNGSNCAAYYGIVCSTLIQIATADPVYWSSREYVYLSRKGYVIPAKDNSATGLRVGDLLPERGHIALITDIVRGNDGVPTDIVLVETYYQRPVEKHYTVETMNNRIRTEQETVVHYPGLYLVPALDAFDAENYEYNEDICTYAGDEAAFYAGEPIWINYTKGTYTGLKLYKDNALIETLTLDADADLHKIDVSTYSATYGDYKACLTDGTNDSGYTYWRVVDTTVSVDALAEGSTMLTVHFSSANAKPTFLQLHYADGNSRGVYLLSADEIAAGTATFDAQQLLMDEYEFEFADHTESGTRFDEKTYVRVFFDCGYGVVTNPILYTGIGTDEE